MSVLIVGGDSGIGQALLNAIPDSIGTSRRDGSNLIKLDVKDKSTYPVFDKKFNEIYYCIGIGGEHNNIDEVININAVRSLELIRHLAPFIADNGNMRIMSSIAGSLEFSAKMNLGKINTGYKMSKACLNIGVIRLYYEFLNINWQLLHPGLVKTKMTEGMKDDDPRFTFITPEESADKILKTPVNNRLSFINVVTGHTIPW